jgi:hypothetical protein
MKGVAVLIAVVALTACGSAPSPGASGGATLPDGVHALELTRINAVGPNDVGPDIVASTSLGQVREAVLTHLKAKATQLCASATDCWQSVAEAPDSVYIAVITNYECTSPTAEATGLGGNTLYFIHWIGKAQRVCNAMMALATWRLYSAPRGDLPKSGMLTVRLELQGTQSDVVDSQVPLA